ncbi:MAG: DUF3990 domain-containing protein [Prevotellaceae bacterium]|jgi:hypothetical protein|nr:DUF3990 domain-containing protein [Prevotellaceae bacterium]
MKLYHGSTLSIDRIDLEKSKPNKDFGKGFYLSADENQAFNFAMFKAVLLDKKPIVNVYEFDDSVLFQPSQFHIKTFDVYDEEWAKFVFANRSTPTDKPIHNYDIVIGPIANDRVGIQIRRYMEQEIDLPTFLERLKYMGGVTFQYFFGTERAIQLLTKL